MHFRALRQWWTNHRAWPIAYEKVARYIERAEQDESFSLHVVVTKAELTAYCQLKPVGWSQIHRLLDHWTGIRDSPLATDATRMMAIDVIKVLDWWLMYSREGQSQIELASSQARTVNQPGRLEETTC
ncbi:hypothetical protein EPO04_02010 [Patescibacteria group bacterium]|nr:MAG: hypothetical protein EPO04_02010 [Patescibacteria group bacterium]